MRKSVLLLIVVGGAVAVAGCGDAPPSDTAVVVVAPGTPEATDPPVQPPPAPTRELTVDEASGRLSEQLSEKCRTVMGATRGDIALFDRGGAYQFLREAVINSPDYVSTGSNQDGDCEITGYYLRDRPHQTIALGVCSYPPQGGRLNTTTGIGSIEACAAEVDWVQTSFISGTEVRFIAHYRLTTIGEMLYSGYRGRLGGIFYPRGEFARYAARTRRGAVGRH